MGLTAYTLLSTTHAKDSPTLDLPDHESSAKAYLRRILARYPPSPSSPPSPMAPTLELKHHHHHTCPTQPISIPASLSRRRRQSSSSSSFSTTSKEEREKGEGLYKTRSNELAGAAEKRASVVWAEMESERMLWGTFLGLG